MAGDVTAGDGDPVEIAGRLWPTFRVRRVVLPGYTSDPFDETIWRDALVIVESGTVEVETLSGLRRAFGVGDILWLTGLPVRALHNPGLEDAVLAAVSRPPAHDPK